MTYNVLMWTLNPTHSLTHSLPPSGGKSLIIMQPSVTMPVRDDRQTESDRQTETDRQTDRRRERRKNYNEKRKKLQPKPVKIR